MHPRQAGAVTSWTSELRVIGQPQESHSHMQCSRTVGGRAITHEVRTLSRGTKCFDPVGQLNSSRLSQQAGWDEVIVPVR